MGKVLEVFGLKDDWAKQAEKEWQTMAGVATASIALVIQELNKIPREIVTIHRIVTVYETRGSSPKPTTSRK